MEDLSGNWTVMIEVTCCAMYIRTRRTRYSVKITILLILAFLAGMLGLQQMYLNIPLLPDMWVMLCNILLLKLVPMFLLCLWSAEGGLCTAMFLFALGFTTAELFGAVIQFGLLPVLTAAGIGEGLLRQTLIAAVLAACLLVLYQIQRVSGIFDSVRIRRSTALLAFVVSYISFAVSYLYGWGLYAGGEGTSSQYLSITIYLSGLLILFLLQYSLREGEMREEMQTVQHTLDLRYQQYQDYVNNTAYLARQLHDMKHQIAGLRALEARLRETAVGADCGNIMFSGTTENAGLEVAAGEGAGLAAKGGNPVVETEIASEVFSGAGAPAGGAAAAGGPTGGVAGRASAELSSYIHDLDQAIARYETWNVSGNSVLDALLTQKKLFCAEHGIQLLVHADGKALESISARDICTIFGNLLDNAAEAVQKLPDPKECIIQVEVGRTGEFLLIRVENRCGEDVIVSGEGLPRTTKRDKVEHGIGLKSVRLTAEGLGGSLNLSAQDGWFTAGVLLPAGEQRAS